MTAMPIICFSIGGFGFYGWESEGGGNDGQWSGGGGDDGGGDGGENKSDVDIVNVITMALV